MRRVFFNILLFLFASCIVSCSSAEAPVIGALVPGEYSYRQAAKKVLEGKKGIEVVTNFSYQKNVMVVKEFLGDEIGFEFQISSKEKAFVDVLECHLVYEKVRIIIPQEKKITVWIGIISSIAPLKEDSTHTKSLAEELRYFISHSRR